MGHVWLLYTADWTSMAICNGKTATSLYYNGPLTITVNCCPYMFDDNCTVIMFS